MAPRYLIAAAAVAIGLLTRLALEPIWNFRSVLRCPGGDERDGTFGADVRFHRGARPCLGSGRKRGQHDQALGRSRGGSSTFTLKTDFQVLSISFHLTGDEARKPKQALLLGRVDGFDQDEAESKRDERAVILRRLLAIRLKV